MTEQRPIRAERAPWHLWVMGIASLLWNAVGAFDYVMTETRNEAYMSSFTPQQLEFFYGFPAWVVAAWAIAVWGGVVGSVLLLLRTRHAVTALIVSFSAMVVTTVHNVLLSKGFEVMGGSAADIAFSAAIFIVALFLVIYARAMRVRGVIA